MNDPSATLFAPVPRYLLESDSEDEFEATIGAGPSRPKIQVQAQPFTVRGVDNDELFDQVVLGVGQAGRYLSRKLDSGGGTVTVERGEEVIGTGSVIDGSLSLSVKEVDHSDSWNLAGSLQQGIKASSWIVLTTYLPAMYIPQPHSTLPKSPPIRYISTRPLDLPESVAKFESPNFVDDLSAALASIAIHPTSSGLSTTILSLPLPLSSLPTASLTAALTALSPNIAKLLSRAETHSTRWDEHDDEPFEAPGMGAGKRSKAGTLTKEDVGSMYM